MSIDQLVFLKLQQWHDSGTFFAYSAVSSEKSRNVDSAVTQQLFYRRNLDNKVATNKPTLLVIHGYPTSTYDFYKLWPNLVEHFDVLAMDMLGMGFSDKPVNEQQAGQTDAYSVMSQTDRFAALLEHHNIQHYHILAHDLGVRVAQELLVRNHNVIESVTFLNGGLFNEVYRPRWTQKLLSSPLGGLISPYIPKTLFVKTMRKMFAPQYQLTEHEMNVFWELVNVKKGRRVTHKVGRFTLEGKQHRDRWAKPLEEAVVPMRLINGSVDPNSGSHLAEHYRKIVPNADVVDLPDTGHWPQLENPTAVLQAFLAFTARL